MTPEHAADRRWRTAVLAVGGLLVAIAAIGIVGVVINRNIHETVNAAIVYDVELEDSGDDLQVAILEVRHYHRDLLLNNPDPTRIRLWQGRYDQLVDEIDKAEAAIANHPARDELPDVEELRVLAEAYAADFRTALLGVDDLASFERVATDLLVPLDAMRDVAVAIDRAGEERSAAAYEAIDDASSTGALVLILVLAGLGAVGGVLGYAVLRLVQDQRRLVSAEQAAAAQMAEISRAKTDFIADASHELRTPLTVLRGNAEVGLAIDDGCAHAEILSEIVAESARMSRLVDDLLFLARSDASSVPLELRDVDVGELMAALAGRAEVLARERGARLRSRVAAHGSLRGDPGRIEQAVLILVDNAAKYGPDEGLIELEATTTQDRLRIAVLDRGRGIPAEQRARIFERFYRISGDGRSRPAGGAGLGLSIAAAIADGHGGTIAAADRPGGGTAMTLVLPLRTARASAPAPERIA